MKTITQQYHAAFRAAQAVDDTINGLLQDHPIEYEPHFWLKFARTIRTTCDVLTDLVEQDICPAVQPHSDDLSGR